MSMASHGALSLTHVCVFHGNREVLHDASVEVLAGELVVVVGPNGAGKSTLLRAAAGVAPPSSGTVSYAGHSSSTLSPEALARLRAVLTQQTPVAFGFTAREIVEMGRHPFRAHASSADVVGELMRDFDVAGLSERTFATLSGGEQQRVHWARLFAQAHGEGPSGERPGWLLLDEPTSSLDAGRALSLLRRLREQVDRGTGALVVLHDLNMAMRLADRVVVIVGGEVVAQAVPSVLMNAEQLGDWFDVSVRLVEDPESSLPLIVPHAPRGASPEESHPLSVFS